MSASAFLLILVVAFVSGWFCCSYSEQQERLDRAKARRRHPATNKKVQP